MAQIDEVAPDVYRIPILHPELNMQFNHFLVKDEEPLLFHTGMRRMFPVLSEAVGRLIDPASLRWISWSHFEVDECGALNERLALAPRAQPLCGQVGAMVNVQDFANRPPVALAPPQTRRRLEELARLEPRLLAATHGSAFQGDGAAALRATGDAMEQLLGAQLVSG